MSRDSQDSTSGEGEVFTPPEPSDFELGDDREGWDEAPPPSGDERGSPWLVPAVVGIVVLLGVGLWMWFGRNGGPPPLPPGPEAPAAPAPPAEASVPMPEADDGIPPPPALDESDAWLREALPRVVEHPRLAAWLAPDGLVRRFVATVDDVARGESPRGHLASMDPGRGFDVDERGDGSQVIGAGSFRRYDALVDAFVSVDTPEAMALYRRLEPLFDEAYRDLGYPDAEFRWVLETALDRLLEVEVPDEAPRVEPRITSWSFVDAELESLSPAEKHLVRLGPRNAAKVQGKLRALKAALTLDPRSSR